MTGGTPPVTVVTGGVGAGKIELSYIMTERQLSKMPNMLITSTKEQIVLPANLRAEYDIEALDKISCERIGIGCAVRQVPKNLLDYKGFIKEHYDPEKDLALAVEAASVHVMGDE